MPDTTITREEARNGLRKRLANIERNLREWDDEPGAPSNHAYAAQLRETAAIYRLALAALEDAERLQHLIDNTYYLGENTEAVLREYSIALLIAGNVEWPDGLRAAIDRARGTVTDGA